RRTFGGIRHVHRFLLCREIPGESLHRVRWGKQVWILGRLLQKRYRNILTRGAKQLPPIQLRQNGKRGRVAKSDAHNLWERLKKHETAVLLFARLSHVPFTNNRAERDLRMSKVKQKVSGCFRTRKYAEAYCRISSYHADHGKSGIQSAGRHSNGLFGTALR
ncbi:IS66 family transposase, partial [Thiolapillus sp.]|uniref:IS66 family transposase n=2 Tax=Thiolapillus sp. TaxID=2017437 RepID=UPI0035A81F62